MPKARRVLAALTSKKGGWTEVRREGSHRMLQKGSVQVVFWYHDADELGTTQLRILGRKLGYTLEELRNLI